MPRASNRSSWRTSSIWRPTDASARSPRSRSSLIVSAAMSSLIRSPTRCCWTPSWRSRSSRRRSEWAISISRIRDEARSAVDALRSASSLGLLEPDQRGRAGGLDERLVARQVLVVHHRRHRLVVALDPRDRRVVGQLVDRSARPSRRTSPVPAAGRRPSATGRGAPPPSAPPGRPRASWRARSRTPRAPAP